MDQWISIFICMTQIDLLNLRIAKLIFITNFQNKYPRLAISKIFPRLRLQYCLPMYVKCVEINAHGHLMH